jgi:hypothetical protein
LLAAAGSGSVGAPVATHGQTQQREGSASHIIVNRVPFSCKEILTQLSSAAAIARRLLQAPAAVLK